MEQTPKAVTVVADKLAGVKKDRQAEAYCQAGMRRIHDEVDHENLPPDDEVILPHRDILGVRVPLVALNAHVVVGDAGIGRDFPHIEVLPVENHRHDQRKQREKDHDQKLHAV